MEPEIVFSSLILLLAVLDLRIALKFTGQLAS
jgi:hypothetical protein